MESLFVLATLACSVSDARLPQAPRPPQAPAMLVSVSESRAAWVANPKPAIAVRNSERAKACPCSLACTCGCNDGQSCTCGNPTTGRMLMRSEFIPAMMPTWSYQATPAFSGGFGGGGVMRGGC